VRRGLALAGAATLLLATGCTLNRPADPVVMTGTQLPALNDVTAGDVVAFRWVNGWDQVPVQVDERKVVDFGTVYNQAPTGFTTTAYADAGTFTGADTDPDVDANDELVFMSKDAGLEAPGDAAAPAGVVAGSGLKVRVRSTLGGETKDAWVYLFERSGGGLSPGAGESYVDYDFNLLSGDYKTTYKLQDGPNPENTTITTPFYVDHFSDRWLNDQIKVKAGNATEADILDRAKALLGPGNCGRSEDTFNDAEGAFVTNKVGPVRAIRSYVGANSGPRTQREHVFYEQRQDIRTFLRVHAIPGPWDFFDYSAAASGMTYRNNLNTGGVTIDGVPDSVTNGTLSWESVDGPQGGLSMVHTLVTDITGLNNTSHYLDDSTPAATGPERQCTGDAQAFGESGPWLNSGLPNTDPGLGTFNTLNSTRTIYFEEPGRNNGAARAAQVANQFQVSVSALP
jgi:hypothetical protein